MNRFGLLAWLLIVPRSETESNGDRVPISIDLERRQVATVSESWGGRNPEGKLCKISTCNTC